MGGSGVSLCVLGCGYLQDCMHVCVGGVVIVCVCVIVLHACVYEIVLQHRWYVWL